LNIRQITGTFGKLENYTLYIKEGLNVISAPNESGKSTWCALLRAMFYGLPTRTSGPAADKNRYAPRSGSAMAGRMELVHNGRALTAIRRTARPDRPMADFSVRDSESGTVVTDLTAANFGETLLGVPREVFERSSFIAQNALAVEQSAELERRIAAIVSTGEEGSSCREAMERLKKQLQHRRYRKSGLIPRLEEEISLLKDRLRRSESLRAQLTEDEALLPQLEEEERALLSRIEQLERSAHSPAQQEYNRLCAQLAIAEDYLAQLQRSAASLPERSELLSLKAAAGNVLALRLNEENARHQLALRCRETAEAEKERAKHPLYSPLTGEQARAAASETRKQLERHRRAVRHLRISATVACLLALLCAASLAFSVRTLPYLAPVFLLLALALFLRAQKAARHCRAILAPYRSQADILAEADIYYNVYAHYADTLRAQEQAQKRHRELANSAEAAFSALLIAVQRFDSTAYDLNGADEAIRTALAARDALTAARQNCDALCRRCESAAAMLTPDSRSEEPGNLKALTAQLSALREQREETLLRLGRISAQLAADGDPAAIAREIRDKETLHAALEREYSVFSLAMSALEEANEELQNRFSPELSKKCAKYFAKLTKGKYNTVLLQRTLEAAAETEDDPYPISALQLSQGAADQLYLSLRLAICDLLLPPGTPLVLDDALTAFDDERAAAALEVLLEISQSRQVLLFTCQDREERLLRARGAQGVTYISL